MVSFFEIERGVAAIIDTSNMSLYELKRQRILKVDAGGVVLEFDEFAGLSFPDTEWMQRIWEITGRLWYHEDAAAFLYPVSVDDLGVYYQDYLNIIEHPTDLSTIREKIKSRKYLGINDWEQEVEIMFENCKTFNDEQSEIYRSAKDLQKFFREELRKNGIKTQELIRIK